MAKEINFPYKVIPELVFRNSAQTGDLDQLIELFEKGFTLSKEQIDAASHPVRGSDQICLAYAQSSNIVQPRFIELSVESFAYDVLYELAHRGLLEENHLKRCAELGMVNVVAVEANCRQLCESVIDDLIAEEKFDVVKHLVLRHQQLTDNQVDGLIETEQIEILGLLALDEHSFTPSQKQKIENLGFGEKARTNGPETRGSKTPLTRSRTLRVAN